MKNPKAIIALLVLLGGTLAQAAVINDTFADGSPGTNPGDGNGFISVENTVAADGSYTESDGQLQIRTGGVNNHVAGIVSADEIPLSATNTLSVFWDVARIQNYTSNGIEFYVQNGTGFRPNQSLHLRLASDGSILVRANGTTLTNSIAYVKADALDGFSVALTANSSGWTFSFSGLGAVQSISGTSYGGNSFDGLLNNGRVAATIQGAASVGELDLNAIVAAVIAPQSGTVELYVSEDGNDHHSGSMAEPLKTLEGARQKVAGLGRPLTADVKVFFREGTYRFRDPVVFGVYDGDPDHTVTYQAVADETVVFSGGETLTNWVGASGTPQPFAQKQGLYYHLLPDGVDRNHVLFDGGEFLPPAASDGYAPKYTEGEAKTLGIPLTKRLWCDSGDILKDWDSYSFTHNVELSIQCAQFTHDFLDIVSYNLSSNMANTTAGMDKLRKINELSESYTIVNAPEYCDDAGEWVVNEGDKIWYLPVEGGAPSQEIVVPRLTELVRLEGGIDYDGPEDVPVENIRFEGITFRHGDRYKVTEDDTHLHSHWQVFDRPSALLRMRGARDCSVERCVFESSGGDGVRLDLFAVNNSVTNCTFRNLGGSGVLINGYGPGTKNVSRSNTVASCYIVGTGKLNLDAPAVMINNSGDNFVVHNKIHDVSYAGIAVVGGKPWKWRSNPANTIDGSVRWHEIGTAVDEALDAKRWDDPVVISYLYAHDNEIHRNEVFDVVNRLGDGNGIYLNVAGYRNVVADNFVHHMLGPHASGPLRVDDVVDQTDIRDNIVYNCIKQGFQYKKNNTITNNLIVDILEADHPLNRYGVEFAGNILLKRGPTTNGLVAGNLIYHRGSTADFINNDPMAGREDWRIELAEVNNDHDFLFMSRDAGAASDYIDGYLASEGVGQNSVGLDPLFDYTRRDFSLRANSPAANTALASVFLTDDIGNGDNQHARTVQHFFNTYSCVIDSDLNESAGTAVSNRLADIPGTFLNGTWRVPGISGRAAYFSDDSKRVQYAADALLSSDAFSAACWVSVDHFSPTNQTILYKEGSPNWRVLLKTDGRIRFDTSDGKGICETINPVETNVWVHVAVSYDGTSTALYLNGVLQSTHTADSMYNTSNADVLLGGFAGKLDEFKFFRRDISADEVAGDYHHTGAVFDWEMEIGGGSLLLDSGPKRKWTRLQGNPAWSDGFHPGSRAVDMDGVNDRIEFTDADNAVVDDLSVRVRFKTPSPSDAGVLIIKGGAVLYDWDLAIRGADKLEFHAKDPAGQSHTLSSIQSILPDTWYDVVVQRNTSGLIEMFINNELENQSSTWMTGPVRDSGDIILVGWGPSAGCSEITVDEVQLFDRVLGADEIAAAYGAAPVPDYGYAAWSNSYALAEGALGDDDGDGLLNLYEYGLGGNPTNGFIDGHLPLFGNSESGLVYVHAQRTDDTNLLYYLETTEDLVGEPGWTNTGYTVVATNVTGGTFDYVTNAIPTTAPRIFIRLIIE